MAATAEGNQLSNAVLAFALQGRFPEDIDSLPAVSDAQLQPSIDSLQKAKQKLETEVHTINEETKEDVGTWVRTAKALQEDIIRSKAMANEIVRQSEAPDTSGEAIDEAESKVQFLNREVQYSQQLHEVLGRIKRATLLLDQVELARDERRILDSLRLLEQSWNALDNVGVGKSCRVIRLLDVRAFELKSSVHLTFDHVWNSLISIDTEKHAVTLHAQTPEGGMSLSDAEVGLRAYKEMDERMEQLWRNIDATIVAPRMQVNVQTLPSILVNGATLSLAGSSTTTADSLLADLTSLVEFLARRLPPGLLKSMNSHIVGDILPRLLQNWLDREVPTSLVDMAPFSRLIQQAAAFRDALEKHGYAGFDELSDWVAQAPTIWLGKCRDTAMDGVRNRLSEGIQGSRQIEKVQKRVVTMEEPREGPPTEPESQFDEPSQAFDQDAPATSDSNDWNDGWGADWDDNQATSSKPASKAAPAKGDVDTGDSWAWGDESDGNQETKSTGAKESDSWDWGDGDTQTRQGDAANDSWDWDESPVKETAPRLPSTPASKPKPKATPKPTPKSTTKTTPKVTPKSASQNTPKPTPKPTPKSKTTPIVAKPKKPVPKPAAKAAPQTKEIVVHETYSISSLPEPVLALLLSVLEDAAALTTEREEYSLVSGTAAGLFGMPTLALALFRAISPHYYSLSDGGNMYLYNDAMYLADQLTEFAAKWKDRQDLTPRAKSMLRLDNDIRTLRSFANRSYATEMATQKTVLHDLLGVSQSIMQQDDLESTIEGGAVRVQAMAATWDKILTRSVWSQAVGSLADCLATRIINDVLELPSIGQEEAYNIASAISQATKLDQLFLPSKLAGTEPAADEVALTAHYAPNWLRLQYLSEVLQSNLNDIRFLWCDRELSLYFTTEEMVDLVRASFEDNPKTRDTIRQIKAKKPLSAPL